mmetsp:Transcript_41220/g.131901  ORF Transcript_41220/g.131901 Transcript_41220/m.131901 type:complete len:234 (-) Transcript_41220:587-1288(-)
MYMRRIQTGRFLFSFAPRSLPPLQPSPYLLLHVIVRVVVRVLVGHVVDADGVALLRLRKDALDLLHGHLGPPGGGRRGAVHVEVAGGVLEEPRVLEDVRHLDAGGGVGIKHALQQVLALHAEVVWRLVARLAPPECDDAQHSRVVVVGFPGVVEGVGSRQHRVQHHPQAPDVRAVAIVPLRSVGAQNLGRNIRCGSHPTARARLEHVRLGVAKVDDADAGRGALCVLDDILQL